MASTLAERETGKPETGNQGRVEDREARK